MTNSTNTSSDKIQQNSNIRQRLNSNINELQNFELHLVDETYDESQDPDFTMSNINNISLSELEVSDDDDEDDNNNKETLDDDDEDDDDDEILDLADSDTDLDSSLTTNDENVKTKSKNNNNPIESINKNNSNSSVNLSIHKKFYSFIHKNEVPRKLFHVSIGFISLYLHCHGYKTKNIWKPVSIAVSCIFLLDLIRFNWPYFNSLYCSVVGFLMREKEINSINGVIWFQLGCVITFIFQKQDVSVMSVLLLSWSDTAASTIGRKFGYLSPKLARGKSLIGSFAAFITGIIACYTFYGLITPNYPQISKDFEYNPNNNILNLHTLALLSGFIAAVSEGIDIAGLDDNLTIPVLSGFFLSSVIKLGKLSN